MIARLVAILVLGLSASTLLARPSMVHAQSLPALFYGKGLRAGANVTATIGGASCGSVAATAAGEWVLIIAAGTCGAAPGASISFAVDGTPTSVVPAAVWQAGGTPPGDAIVNGYVLGVAQVSPAPAGSAGGSVAGPSGVGVSPAVAPAGGGVRAASGAGSGPGATPPAASTRPQPSAEGGASGIPWLSVLGGVAAVLLGAGVIAWRSQVVRRRE